MTSTLSVGAFGITVHATLPHVTPQQAHRIQRDWARCAPHTDWPSHTLQVQHSPPPVDGVDTSRLEHELSTHITLALIHHASRTHLLLHGCAIADPRTGAVAALLAPSGTGKTTAAIALSRHYGYITDETVAIDSTHTVHPYPKPLSTVQTGTLIKRQVSPDGLGLHDLAGYPPLNLTAIALLDRNPETPMTPTLTPVPLGDAIAELVPQISYLSARPKPLQQLASTVEHVGGIHRLTYHDASQLTDVVPRLLRSHDSTGRGSEWTPAPDHSAATRGVRRAAVTDAITNGQHTIVLHDGIVRVLDGIGPAVWNAADGIPLDQLTDNIVALHGEPPSGAQPDGNAQTLVLSVVDHLIGLGLLEQDT